MSLQFPWGLLALLAIPVIILLYLLKQKHEEQIISSLYLWQNALQDLEANAPWQKLRKNILMFLQIGAVLLLALTLSGLLLQNRDSGKGSVLLVIDCSLSMQSTDMKPSRFEAVRKDAVHLVESSGTGTTFSLVVSSHTPYMVLNDVPDKNKVIQEINRLQTTDMAENREGTLELVLSMLQSNSEMQAFWFGDSVRTSEDERIHSYSYNRNGDNYAVTLLTPRQIQKDGSITALSRISNFSLQDAELDVSLYTDGAFFDSRRVTVGAGTGENLYWTDIPGNATRLDCTIDTPDVLTKDNTAGAMISSDKKGKVLLATDRNIYLEKVLSLIPDMEIYRTSREDMNELKGYDLYIFDGQLPDQLPEDGSVILFHPPENEHFSIAGVTEYSEIRSVQHHLFDGLGESSFSAKETATYELPAWGSPLLENEDGITAFEGYLGKKRVAVFGFDLHNTNLPVQPFFPVMMTRIVQELLPGSSNKIVSVNAGDPIELSIDPEAETVQMVTPDGNREALAPPFPVTVFGETFQTGTYLLEQELADQNVQQNFIVNAPSEKEFALSNEAVDVPKDTTAAQSWNAPVGQSLKTVLLWLLLAILLIEWWVYTNGTKV